MANEIIEIKVQRLQGGSDDVVLTNEDWQFHKLVEHLDHALMHGLKHITNGYWVVVQEFTPKSTIKEITYLQNVTTNLGRGRAWLYLALMDQLLESYIKCYMDNGGRVARYYLKDALMLDTTRVQVIQTLASGLEFITFKLTLDVAYLDLSSHAKTRSQSCEDDDEGDRDSLASTNSTQSVNTIPEVGVDVASLAGDLEGEDSVAPLHTSSSTPAFRNSSFTDSATFHSPRLSLQTDKEAGLEVIRHKVKVKKKKDKKAVKTDSDSLSSVDTNDRVSVSSLRTSPHMLVNAQVMCKFDTSPLSPESGYKSVTDGSLPKANGHATLICDSQGQRDSENPNTRAEGKSNLVSETCQGMLEQSQPNTCDGKLCQSMNELQASLSTKSSQNSVDILETNHDQLSCKPLSESSSLVGNVDMSVVYRRTTNSSQSSEPGASQSTESSALNDNQTTNSCLSSCNSTNASPDPLPSQSSISDDSEDAQTLYGSGIYSKADTHTLYGSGIYDKSDTGSNPDLYKLTISQEDGKQSSSSTCQNSTEVKQEKPLKQEHPHEWDLDVDNNTKLYLMLEVFYTEEEMLIKMFPTCLGHTEGDVVPIHLVITDLALYLTTKGAGSFHFSREAMVTFRELDYISLSLGYQVINIVCTNRRKKFWITTGSELMTKAIVGHIDNAIRHSHEDIPRLSVLTDATHQKIAIKKWASSEVTSQKNDLQIHDYSLVYWEDAEVSSASWLQVGASKSGTLHYKSHDSYFGFGGPVWKPAYFVLKDGALFMYSTHHDSLNGTPALKCIQLNYEECQGVRSCRHLDREYCLEVVLRDGHSLQLSANDLTHSQEWLQSLCQAVAQGMGDLPPTGGPVACCSVLIANRLLLCHEDVETNFMRTLAAANVIDITSVNMDADVNTYCVLKFDSPSHAEQQKWVLYFNSCPGRDSFLTALKTAWTALFQVEFVVKTLDDGSLLKHCRDTVKTLSIQRKA